MLYTIYGKENCQNCIKAKMILDMKSKEYEYIDASNDDEIFNWLVGRGFRSMPQIFCGKEYVGGYEELKDLIG